MALPLFASGIGPLGAAQYKKTTGKDLGDLDSAKRALGSRNWSDLPREEKLGIRKRTGWQLGPGGDWLYETGSDPTLAEGFTKRYGPWLESRDDVREKVKAFHDVVSALRAEEAELAKKRGLTYDLSVGTVPKTSWLPRFSSPYDLDASIAYAAEHALNEYDYGTNQVSSIFGKDAPHAILSDMPQYQLARDFMTRRNLADAADSLRTAWTAAKDYKFKPFDGKLTDLLDMSTDPEFAMAYPDFKDINVRIEKSDKPGLLGSFSKKDNRLTITEAGLKRYGLRGALSTALHELGHGRQDKEGAAPGGNEFTHVFAEPVPKEFLRADGEKLIRMEQVLENGSWFHRQALGGDERLRRRADDLRLALAFLNQSRDKYDRILARANSLHGDDKLAKAHEMYRSLAGEVDARNMSTRNNMSRQARLDTLLEDTEDVPRDYQFDARFGLDYENFSHLNKANQTLEEHPWVLQQDAKGGNSCKSVRADAKGGDSPGSETAVPETPVSEPAPQAQGGPRIIINPTTFKNKKDALCVAFNEGFRLWMEANDFQPQSEPTDRQRRFFSDTAYADDELQLRRTILARVATFDTSVKDPTDDQLTETAQFLDGVLESGWCKNEWEQDSVSRLSQAVKAAIGAEPVEPREAPLEPAQAEPLEPAGGEEVQALQSGGSTDDEEEDKFALQNAGKSFAVDYVESQNLKRREAELASSIGMTPPEGQEQAQEPAAGQGAPTVQPEPPDAPQAGKPAESDEPTDEQVRQAEERNRKDLTEVQRGAGRPKLTLASPVDSGSPGSIAYKGSRSGDIRESIVDSGSQGSIAFRGARRGGIESPIVESGSTGSIAFSGTRPGGIEDSIVGSDAKGSIAGVALDYAPGSIESPVDDPRRKEERRKRRDRRRRGLL